MSRNIDVGVTRGKLLDLKLVELSFRSVYVNFEQSGLAGSSIQLADNYSQISNSMVPSSSVRIDNISCQGNACTENNSTTFCDKKNNQ